MSTDKENARRAIDRATEAGQSDLDIPSAGLTDVSYWPIVLQKSKVAPAQIFGENLKRKEVDDSHSLSRATEVAHEFGARR